jgi:hypothetical protein
LNTSASETTILDKEKELNEMKKKQQTQIQKPTPMSARTISRETSKTIIPEIQKNQELTAETKEILMNFLQLIDPEQEQEGQSKTEELLEQIVLGQQAMNERLLNLEQNQIDLINIFKQSSSE